MYDESLKIIKRRFMNRFLESGLLIIAVALGIGAASAGMALLANTVRSSRLMLESPDYQEIVVSTASDADDMADPVSLKPVQETAILTSADLAAGEIAPSIVYSYVKNNTRMHFLNEESIVQDEERKQTMNQRTSDQEGANPGPPPEDENSLRNSSLEDLEDYALDGDILIVDMDETNGYEVTPGFFNAWKLNTSAGSLFTESDMNGTASLVVLGSDLADLMTPEGEEPSSLLGKKLLTRDALVSIVGILEPQKGDENNNAFFSPYQSDQGLKQFRQKSMNTQLRFTVDEPEQLDDTALLLQNWFDSQYGEEQIVISNPRSEALQLTERNTGIGFLIMFLSLAGLFIASVNVSNILMSRGMRMKKHVGILMALGASRKRVMKLFGTESLGITVLGATLGTLLSIPLGQYMQRSLDISSSSWTFTLMGVLVSAALTLLFGLLPALQYSKIDPALAMRAA